MLPTTITTEELRLLTGYAKSSIVALEQEGIIARTAKDTWAIETIPTLIAHLRERKPVVSEQRARIEAARARALELKVAREEGLLAPLVEWNDAMNIIVGKILTGLIGLPPRYTRDIAERRRLEGMIDELRADVANWCTAEAARLEETARRSARQRL